MNTQWNELKAAWTPRDCLDANSLTVIENDTRYLHEELNKLPYSIPVQTYKIWDYSGIPVTDDIWRICENIKVIADYYYEPPKYERLSDIPNKESLDNVDMNDIEECLLWLYQSFKLLLRNYNTHLVLRNKPLTHTQLSAFKHIQIKKDWNITT